MEVDKERTEDSGVGPLAQEAILLRKYWIPGQSETLLRDRLSLTKSVKNKFGRLYSSYPPVGFKLNLEGGREGGNHEYIKPFSKNKLQGSKC